MIFVVFFSSAFRTSSCYHFLRRLIVIFKTLFANCVRFIFINMYNIFRILLVLFVFFTAQLSAQHLRLQ